MIINIFSQLYRSKSSTLEILYNMKNRFLVMHYLFTLKQQSAKTISTCIRIDSDRTLNEYIWTKIQYSQWYEIKIMWNRNRAYLQPKIRFINCWRTYIAQSRFSRKKEANEIRCCQNSYLGFYTSENIYIFRCITRSD